MAYSQTKGQEKVEKPCKQNTEIDLLLNIKTQILVSRKYIAEPHPSTLTCRVGPELEWEGDGPELTQGIG